MSTKIDGFLLNIKNGAIKLWGKFGILPSVAAGQAALESAWGGSVLATKYNNLFGIKGTYQGNSAMMNTWEVYGGERYDIKDNFRVYPNWATSILDYGVFLSVNQRYKKAIGLKNYKLQIKTIHNAGYATDPQYADKVTFIIEKYGLAAWDKEVLEPKKEEVKQTSTPSKTTSKTSSKLINYPGTVFIAKKPYQTGKDVERIQNALNNAVGKKIVTVDGIYGPKTAKAVEDYQLRHKLTVDGKVGPQTWKNMF
ncbi:glucosaminidase domain-containing protein [Niallia alba]|uniref:Glucosaminidase domain-containing protein n=1 Tax=Niallia circulans TaxID=1397 RepID=A0A941JR13_NIACI|nr:MULTISPECIES: glucosaminidase domain-containing protein [Niallia]MCB5236695.1 glucosaminidase domain-containing protein [Niallia circulans]MED3792146.1 glucosaminidase domain-containing protein [Niallia alba]